LWLESSTAGTESIEHPAIFDLVQSGLVDQPELSFCRLDLTARPAQFNLSRLRVLIGAKDDRRAYANDRRG
jgi:hypothetical protein